MYISSFARSLAQHFLALAMALSTSHSFGAEQANTIAYWSDIVAKNPNDWDAHQRLGRLLSEQGKPWKALKEFKKASELKGDDPALHLQVANCLLKVNRPDQAALEFQATLKFDPNNDAAKQGLKGLKVASATAPAGESKQAAATPPPLVKPLTKAGQAAQFKARIAAIDQEINENKKRALTPRSEPGFYSNVSEDFSKLMAKNVELRKEQETLQRNLLQLTGEDARQPEGGEQARAAADAFLAALKEQGVVFGSEYRTMINYRLENGGLPSNKIEVIYTLDYANKLGQRIVGPYTICVEQQGRDNWRVIGCSAGDRRGNFTSPTVGTDGQVRRSPMEQLMGEAMNGGSTR